MRKLIHSKFELLLSQYRITDTEENPWFLDEIPLKFTFPFEIDLTDENDLNFGFISSYQTSPETLYPLVYQNGNQMEEALLELEDLTGRKLTANFSFGLEQLPSWEKKLSELSLDNFELVGETIYEHAKTTINKKWPEVSYNFPQVHIDTIDLEEELWEAFSGRINNYNGTEFPENYVEDVTYLPKNPTIIQPLPYALHLLIRGLADANLELQGSILDDERLKNKCFYTPKEYFLKRDNPIYEAYIYRSEYVSIHEPPVNPLYAIGYYTVSFDVIPGRYNIFGEIRITERLYDDDPGTFYRIYYDGMQIDFDGDGAHPIDLEVNNDTLSLKTIKIDCYSRIPFPTTPPAPVIDIQVLPLELYDSSGNSIPTIVNENKVDLTKAVPDMTFGDYFKNILNWYNYDYEILDGIITMNKVEDQINYDNAFDLSAFEIKEPSRSFRKGYSYLLKFQDSENEFGYTYDQVFHSAEGVVLTGFKTDTKTSTIEINALPLPIIERNSYTTAHAFEANESKLYAIMYDGLTNNRNNAKPITDILLPAVHTNYWFNWFEFRINAQEFKWPFKAWSEQIQNLKAKGKAFAYGRYHIIKSIQKTEIQPDLYEIEIEMESMK